MARWALTKEQADYMHKAGFLKREIREINNAKTPDGKRQHFDFNADSVQRMINSRRAWARDRVIEGWSDQKIIGTIMRYYRMDKKNTVFDFIKDEYKVERRRTIGKDTATFKRLKESRSDMTRVFGHSYGTYRKKIYSTTFRSRAAKFERRFSKGLD